MTRASLILLFTAGSFILPVAGLAPAGSKPEQSRPADDTSSSLDAPDDASRDFRTVGHPTFVSPHASPIAVHGERVFVANTPADTVDVIDTGSREIVARVSVGIDPVSVAVRPDGKEVWVSNHVSDSVSVIDTDVDSPTHLQIIATIQDFDSRTKATRFDEPVGIAFAGNDKAYVALSSENRIAVVDVESRRIKRRLNIPAQDPRAIVVRGDRLYVMPFESNNKTQLSGGVGELNADYETFDAFQHSVAVNNVLSLGHVTDIVKHPKVPDRDLFVFDTKTDRLIETVDTLGTLLYGLAVNSRGDVFIAQTDARNDVNGRAGTEKHSLKELKNRAFLNRITRVISSPSRAEGGAQPDLRSADPVRGGPGRTDVPSSDGQSPASLAGKGLQDSRVSFIDLEPLPPEHPEPGQALATPFAIQITDDDSTLVASAAGSDRLFTVDAASGDVVGRVDVGAVPRGIALQHAADGKVSQAWILNAVDNSVSLVDVSDPVTPSVVDTIMMSDPTHPVVKRGRVAFETASASTTRTYSCASCHPDGHTDQLLWVLKTPIVTGGNQIMPRSTMPVRGLRDTEPYHWDGIPGDPYGGNNSANIHGTDEPNSRVDDPAGSTRHLIDGGLASTMAMAGDETVNDEGKAGRLSAAERDDMAVFLLSVPYPPSQRRAYTNVVSERAAEGFRLFHVDGDLDPTKSRPNVCGDCHRMPFLVSTNTPGTGMDAPTWRGAYDRFLILPQGRLNIIDFDFYERVAQAGNDERSIWQFSWAGRRRFDPVWDMVLELSTGYSGTFARQVTLSKSTVDDALTTDLLNALELSASEQAIVLEADGVISDGATSTPVTLQFDADHQDGAYVTTSGVRQSYSRDDLLAMAEDRRFVGTLTARHGSKSDVDQPQPALWTLGPIERQRGQQKFPVLYEGRNRMLMSARHLDESPFVVVDGRRVDGQVTSEGKKTAVTLAGLPSEGMHLLQLQNHDGQFSNEFLFHVVADADAATAWTQRRNREYGNYLNALATAIAEGDFEETKAALRRGADINDHHPATGATPLHTAALFGRTKIAQFLIRQGAQVNGKNTDGNTALHAAAFFCRADVVRLLLKEGADVTIENDRDETPIDVVSGEWNEDLAGFYRVIGDLVDVEFDLERMERERPVMAKMLQSGDDAEEDVRER